jgi:hypothetical protein
MHFWREDRSLSEVPLSDGGTASSEPFETALRAISEAVRHDGDDLRLDDLRDSIRLLCVAAQDSSLYAESVVVGLKRAFDESPLYDGQSLDKRTELRARMISLAIRIYYSEARPSRDGAVESTARRIS